MRVFSDDTQESNIRSFLIMLLDIAGFLTDELLTLGVTQKIVPIILSANSFEQWKKKQK